MKDSSYEKITVFPDTVLYRLRVFLSLGRLSIGVKGDTLNKMDLKNMKQGKWVVTGR